MSLGWFATLVEAKSYFTDSRLITTSWDALSSDALKTKAITNGYNRIFYDPRYDVPTYADATAAQLVILKIVNGEMSYYLAQHMEDADRRMGLRAQGVITAGIVKEEYKEDELMSDVPPVVDAMLEAAGFTTAKVFGFVSIDRDEDENIDYDATDL